MLSCSEVIKHSLISFLMGAFYKAGRLESLKIRLIKIPNKTKYKWEQQKKLILQ
jgi:hypothetical protein